MDVVLWRWSVGVQLTSAAMIAVFFVLLSRALRLAELRWWVWAWTWNLVALAVAASFWFFQFQHPLATSIMRGIYMSSKTAFVVLLLLGSWALKRPGRPVVQARWSFGLVALYGALGSVLFSGIQILGVVQQTVLGILFGVGTILLIRPPRNDGDAWLAGGFAVRSVLGFVAVSAYAVELSPSETFSEAARALASTIAAMHSSFDSGSEWLIALGCVLVLTGRTQRELREYNRALLDTQHELRRIADRDPLTALDNRRNLPAVLRTAQPEGAMLLFFDLDDFKAINDRHGHHVGDQCLQRFADALRGSFRPRDAILRFAGDEFLVVAQALGRPAAEARIEAVRDRLAELRDIGPHIRFSVGVSELPAGGDPDAALEAADASMYRTKEKRQGKPVRR